MGATFPEGSINVKYKTVELFREHISASFPGTIDCNKVAVYGK